MNHSQKTSPTLQTLSRTNREFKKSELLLPIEGTYSLYPDQTTPPSGWEDYILVSTTQM